MFKMICVTVATGVIALSAAVPVVSVGSVALAESRAMLLMATAFFALASAMRWRWKRPGRRGPTRPA